jgi:hypothetical protein
MLRLRCLVKLNNDAYCAVSIQWKIGKIGRFFVVAAGALAFGSSLRTSHQGRQDEDRYHRQKEKPKPVQASLGCRIVFFKSHFGLAPEVSDKAASKSCC